MYLVSVFSTCTLQKGPAQMFHADYAGQMFVVIAGVVHKQILMQMILEMSLASGSAAPARINQLLTGIGLHQCRVCSWIHLFESEQLPATVNSSINTQASPTLVALEQDYTWLELPSAEFAPGYALPQVMSPEQLIMNVCIKKSCCQDAWLKIKAAVP